MLPYDRETQWFFKSLKRRNLPFIGKNRAIKHIIARYGQITKTKKTARGLSFLCNKTGCFNEVLNYCSCDS